MDKGLWYCTEGGEQNHPKEKKRKSHSGYPRRLYKQLENREKRKARRGGEAHPVKCRVTEVTRRDRKAFFHKQCLIIEYSEREKTGDLFRNIANTMEAFCPKMGTIKDKNGSDLVDTEEIKKRWKVYMEELYKKIVMNRITTMVWLVTQTQTFWSVKPTGP